jgi:DNA-binding PadR family transcriptional regulator
MFVKGWVVAEWGHSINNRRARYYRLTPAGRKQLQKEMAQFERMNAAILKVLQPA